MRRRSRGVSALERVEALLANPALYELADLVPDPTPDAGGRQRDYPTFMWLLYEALISVYGSARRVEAELAHPLVWNLIRKTDPPPLPRPSRAAPARSGRCAATTTSTPATATSPTPTSSPRSHASTANSPPTRPASSGSSTPTGRARGPIPI